MMVFIYAHYLYYLLSFFIYSLCLCSLTTKSNCIVFGFVFNPLKHKGGYMDQFFAIVIIAVALSLLFILGKQTLIDWTNHEYDPSVKEVILFIILFMIAQKELSKMFKKDSKS